jgi:GT2 family glycosyltransferase
LKKVSVNILNTNERKFLEKTLPLILDQTYPEFEVTLIDNASTDGSVEFIRENYPQIRVLENAENLGYVGGHNRGITETEGDYVMLLNSDIYLRPDFIEEKVKALEYDSDVGMAEGKLLQIRPDESEFPEYKVVDSTGLAINRMRKNRDRGYGEEDHGQYDREEFIFGPSGATPLYRRDMLEDIRIDDEYFDSTFFIYRDEVDLAWRAQLQGWKCRYNPKAIAYHVRGYSPKSRKQISEYFRQLQFRNRYLMLVKNESFRNFLIDFPFYLVYEILQFGYVVSRELHLFKGYKQFFQLFPEARRKRKIIASRKRVSDAYMRQWFR